jgi:hypothetical protein
MRSLLYDEVFDFDRFHGHVIGDILGQGIEEGVLIFPVQVQQSASVWVMS